MKKENFQICKRCVMDITDPEIYFDNQGICNHCNEFDKFTSKKWFPNQEGKKKLNIIFDKIKNYNVNEDYNCIIGLSGGIDSSYLALLVNEYKLRPLVIHVDAGWNSELAVNNIEKIVKYCGYDLHVHVMDWLEIKDLQLAYLKAGVSNQDVAQDHAFFASLYHYATKNRIKYILTGGNLATESVFPKTWHHSAMDSINLKSIHSRYGQKKLKNYKTISFFEYYFYYPFIKGMTVIRPLNFLPYNKSDAIKFLKEKVDFKDYGRKHGESRFTKFFQNYYLPKKFNMDKRLPHLSSLILSGTISRNQALEELKKPLYEKIELQEDKIYIAKKLGISVIELDKLIKKKGNHYSDYSNWDIYYKVLLKIKKFFKKFYEIKSYS
tara:strand:- start:525 stop:1664 length:1140 start_codon:yes stop_codon:yes gene_type:complete